MRFVVRSRRLARLLDLDEPYVVVSVSDPPPWPQEGPLPERANCVAILRLQFEDVFTERERSMTAAHGDAIAAFLARHSDVPVVVTSCTAGGSRSPSMAMAMADHLKIPRNRIDWGGLPTNVVAPNELVYDRTREAMVRLCRACGAG